MAKKLVTYEGDDVNVTWDGRLCIHVGECGRAQGELFVAGRDPWCSPNLEGVDDVTDVVLRCPTGALSYTRSDGNAETANPNNTVVVAYNGPLYVQGDLAIDGAADDMAGVKFRAALCRCGQSDNKPFCDNSHEGASFKDYGAVGDKGDRDTHSDQGGTLTIDKAPNGPLLLKGNFAILAASGRVAWRGDKAALCRCGHSKNKPFCDGAHKDTGFEAP